jgi:RNA polymerase sigma factor (sigma-70 family)
MPIPGVEERAVLRMDLSNAFGSLEEKYRTPIVMLFLHGFSSEETAKRLNVTRSSVSGMIRRGKEKLREAM